MFYRFSSNNDGKILISDMSDNMLFIFDDNMLATKELEPITWEIDEYEVVVCAFVPAKEGKFAVVRSNSIFTLCVDGEPACATTDRPDFMPDDTDIATFDVVMLTDYQKTEVQVSNIYGLFAMFTDSRGRFLFVTLGAPVADGKHALVSWGKNDETEAIKSSANLLFSHDSELEAYRISNALNDTVLGVVGEDAIFDAGLQYEDSSDDEFYAALEAI
jgi:hypothetical protein